MSEEMTRYEALVLCRDRAGSDSQMARDLKTTQPKVWRWVNQSKQMPAEFVLTAEQFYGVPRHCLRPDIYPVDLPEPPSRWSGVDQCAGIRFTGVDSHARRVADNRQRKVTGAQA